MEHNLQVLLASGVFASTAVLGIVWLSRARAAKRLNAAVEVYAERESARGRRRHVPKRMPSVSARGQ